MEKGRGNVHCPRAGRHLKKAISCCWELLRPCPVDDRDTGATMIEAGLDSGRSLGIGGLPAAGEAFHIVKNERDAKKVSAAASISTCRSESAQGPRSYGNAGSFR